MNSQTLNQWIDRIEKAITILVLNEYGMSMIFRQQNKTKCGGRDEEEVKAFACDTFKFSPNGQKCKRWHFLLDRSNETVYVRLFFYHLHTFCTVHENTKYKILVNTVNSEHFINWEHNVLHTMYNKNKNDTKNHRKLNVSEIFWLSKHCLNTTNTESS